MTFSRCLLMLTLLVVLGQLACGGDEDKLGVTNVSPRGSVGGLILDAATMNPMTGVQATVVAGGTRYPSGDTPAATDATGHFSVQDVPSGNLIVQLTPTDTKAFRAVNIVAALPNSAGEFPLDNATLSLGPIGLLPLTDKNSAFVVQFVTPDGAPAAAGIKAFLRTVVEYVDFKAGDAAQRGIIVVEGATDNSGRVRFVGIPDFAKLAGLVGSGGISDQVRIEIPPFDTNKDGTLEFLGTEAVFNVNRLKGSIPTVVLSSPSAPGALTIEAASIAALTGKKGNRVMSSISGPVYVTFNLPIRQDLTELTLFDELGKPVVSPPTPSLSGNVMTINFSGLKAAAEYNLNLRAFADVEGKLVSGYFGAPLFTPGQAAAAVKAALSRDAGNTNKVLVTFTEPIGSGTAGQSFTGGNAIIFFDYDINGTGVKGDAPGERGASSSNISMIISEVNPPGPAGLSGLSTHWYFTLPVDTMNNPLPAGTAFDMMFSKASFATERAGGKVVPDFKNLIVP
jgi:hypothetical protein